MEISVKLVEYRYHFITAVIVSTFIALLSYGAPRFVTIISYFWPLLASTTVFLVVVVAFGGLPHLSVDPHAHNKTGGDGEGLLDYVAGPHHYADGDIHSS